MTTSDQQPAIDLGMVGIRPGDKLTLRGDASKT